MKLFTISDDDTFHKVIELRVFRYLFWILLPIQSMVVVEEIKDKLTILSTEMKSYYHTMHYQHKKH